MPLRVWGLEVTTKNTPTTPTKKKGKVQEKTIEKQSKKCRSTLEEKNESTQLINKSEAENN